jgi:hypothetical protein
MNTAVSCTMPEWIYEDDWTTQLIQRADDNLAALALLLGGESIAYGELDAPEAYVNLQLDIPPAPRETRKDEEGQTVYDADFRWDFRHHLIDQMIACIKALAIEMAERPLK